MKKIVFFLVTILATVYTNAQTADEIINKYMEAMGGKEKLQSIKSTYMEGTSVMQNGAEITQKIWKVDGKLMRREMNSSMFNMAMLVTDKGGWNMNQRTNGNFEPMPAEMVTNLQGEMDCAGPLVDYAAKGHKAEFLGKEVIDGTEYLKVKLTLKSGRDMTYYFDPKTYYIFRTVTVGGFGGRGGQGGSGEMKTDFSEYKKTDDGYIFPFKITAVGRGGGLFFEKIEVNKPVDEKVYKPETL